MLNTVFFVRNGKIDELEQVAYMNVIRNQAQSAFDELGGIDFDRKTAREYIDESWRKNLCADNYDTGEHDVLVEVSDDQWNDYANAIMDEVEKLVNVAKRNWATDYLN